MKVIEFDVVFLSYDEPNADLHYADLCNKVPWAKRVHGVKGSDAAHKAAAELRLEADKNYKCSLLKDTKIQDDCK